MSAKKQQRRNESTLDQSFRLKKISPMTDTQADAFDAYEDGHNLLMVGYAGTGKSFISSYLALRDILSGKLYHKLIIVRSAVPGRDMGFLPGKIQDKLNAYESPYKAMFSELFGRGDAWEICLTKGIVEFTSTSYMRGITISNAVVLVDEIQNCTAQELETLITRVGPNSRIMFCGDIHQCDLYRNRYDTSGLPNFLQIIENMSSFDVVDFKLEDIVRSGICREFLEAKHHIEMANESAFNKERVTHAAA